MMKNILIAFFLIAVISVKAQKVIPYQNNAGKWGLKNQNEIVIKAQYDRLESAYYSGFELFNHDVLALITDSMGHVLFQPSSKIIKNSNAYLRYYYKDPYELMTLQEELSQSFFVYLSDAVLDTVVQLDTVEFDEETGEFFISQQVLYNEFVVLSKGGIQLVNSKSELLNKKPFQNIAFKIKLRDPMSDEIDGNVLFFLQKSNQDDFGLFFNLPLITKLNIPFKQNNKWGLLSLSGTVLIDPIYDSLVGDRTNSFSFFNHGVLAAIVRQDGKYVFKADEEVVAKANLSLELYIGELQDEDSTIEMELQHSLFLYLDGGIMDTLVYYDSAQVINEEGNFYNTLVAINCPIIAKGDIYIVNAQGKKINPNPIQEISVFANEYERVEEFDPFTQMAYYEGYETSRRKGFINLCNKAIGRDRAMTYLRYGVPELQSNIILYKNDNKWGVIDIKKGVITDALYDSYIANLDGIVHFFNHGILAAIVDQNGAYVFKPDASIIAESDHYMDIEAIGDEPETDTSLTRWLKYHTYLYLSNSVIDTMVINDSIWESSEEESEWEKTPKPILVPLIKQGKIRLIDGLGKTIYQEQIDGLAFLCNLVEEDENYENYEEYYYDFYEKYNVSDKQNYLWLGKGAITTQDYKSFYALGAPSNQSDIVIINKGNKYGLLDLKKGLIVEPIYDSLDYNSNFSFYNHGILIAIVNTKGEYIFKLDKEVENNSNLFLSFKFENEGPNIGDSIYVYVSNASFHVVHSTDSLKTYGPEGEIENLLLNHDDLYISDGSFYLVESNGKLINTIAYDNIAVLNNKVVMSLILDPFLQEDMIFEGYEYAGLQCVKLKSNKVDESGFDANDLYLESKLIPIQQDGKWGLLNLDKGIIIQPAYDSYEYDKLIHFINAGERIISVDDEGNVIVNE